jgi:ACS family glucarate transporter-like MFS transporter
MHNSGDRQVSFSIVALMVALSAMSYLNRTIMSVAAPTLIKNFHLSETQMGSIFSAFILSYAILMVPGGWLADRFGPRWVVALTGGGTAIFTTLTVAAGAPSLARHVSVFWCFLAVRFVMGACAAPFYPACGRMTANWVPILDRARIQGFIIGGAPLGAAITPVLFAWLIARYGWQQSFFFAAAGTLVLTFLWLRYAQDRPPGSSAPSTPTRATFHTDPGAWLLLKNRNILLLSAGYFALNYFEFIFFYWIYYYFGEIRKVGASESAIYTTVLLLAMMVMLPLGGWVSDRLIPRLGSIPACRTVAVAGMVISAALLYVGTNIVARLLMLALLSLALGLAATAEGPFWAAVIDAGGNHVGAAGGILNGVGNVGGLLAPVLTPYIASRFGWPWGLYTGSLIVLAGAVAWFFVRPLPETGLPLRGSMKAESESAS